MGLARVQRTLPARLTHQLEVGEELVDADGPVTVTVTDADGDVLAEETAARTALGTYSVVLSGQPDLGVLTATWSADVTGSAITMTTHVEVAGSFFFTLAAGRTSDESLADVDRYPAWLLERARLETEAEAEAICDRAFVPRGVRIVADGTGDGQLVLSHPDPGRTMAHVRRIVAGTVTAYPGAVPRVLPSWELAALTVGDDATVRRPPGHVWPRGRGNVVLDVEYGLDTPPPDLVRAALVAFRARVHQPRSSIPDRASSFTSSEGGTYRLDMPGATKTGIPAVDSVYARYSRRSTSGPGGRKVAASRTMDYDPQRGSLFHGGRR
ncbi:hypothetical protein [Actinomadura flavalba]|uniref:hypothetical protein n=1 Tax=Actinomadura flavalba TaxID=1120938 RepID=UPI0003784034|nr:hypothetical protein [Actinomadura flavalba]